MTGTLALERVLRRDRPPSRFMSRSRSCCLIADGLAAPQVSALSYPPQLFLRTQPGGSVHAPGSSPRYVPRRRPTRQTATSYAGALPARFRLFAFDGPNSEPAASRIDLHRHPYFYAPRNHIVDFLVSAARPLPPT
jgi:hypothetical protein